VEAKLFNKIVLYTKPFCEMDEDDFPVHELYTKLVRELREDAEDRKVDYYRGTETQRRKKGVPTKYTALEAMQNKKAATACAICSMVFKSESEKHGDHNHKTGDWRGVLCNNCNAAIGMFKDSPEICEAAAQYLKTRQ